MKRSCFRSKLGQNRPSAYWLCRICGRVIEGRANTIHLGIGAHCNAEARRGLRTPEGRPNWNKRDLPEKMIWIALELLKHATADANRSYIKRDIDILREIARGNMRRSFAVYDGDSISWAIARKMREAANDHS